MPVSDCITEYERLGGQVFGKPRRFHGWNIPFLKRTKYSTSKFTEVTKDLLKRRLQPETRHVFKFDKDLCKT